MMRIVFSFLSMLALGVMTAAGLSALIPWMTGRGGATLASQYGFHLESMLLGLALGLSIGLMARYNWADIPRRFVTFFLIRERQFFYYTLISGCVAVLLFY